MDALSVGTAGLAAASLRFDQSAQRTFSGREDLTDSFVDKIEARTEYSASLAVIRSANDMSKQLLNITI